MNAACEWFGAFLIAISPLMLHLLLYLAVDGADRSTQAWHSDMLVFCVTNSGLTSLTVFVRMAKGDPRYAALHPHTVVCMAFNMCVFLITGMLFGAVASGHAQGLDMIVCAIAMVASAVTSIYFELSLALTGLEAAVPAAE